MESSQESTETASEFTVAIKVERDVNRDHSVPDNYESLALNSTDAMPNPSTGMLVCLHCYQHFEPSELPHHMITTHKYRNVRFKCHNCKQTFDERSNLIQHKQECFPLPKKRKRKSFMDMLSEIEKQYEAAKANEVFPCPVCFVKVPKCSLREHVITEHSGDSFYRCDTCNKRFKYKFTLRDHIKLVHEAVEDSVECDMCDQKFRSAKYLYNHKRNVHPAEDASRTCYECDKSFKTATCLRQHRRYVHPPDTASVPCRTCNKTFKSKMNLHQHMKIVHKRTNVKD